MERGNAAGEIAVTDLIKAGRLNQINESVLIGKIANTFHQIPVRLRIARDNAEHVAEIAALDRKTKGAAG